MPRTLTYILAAFAFLFCPRPGLTAEATLYPYLEVAGVYNDNVRQQTGGNGRGDFIATQLLGATLETDAPAKHFTLNYSTLASQYVSDSSLDRTFQDHYVGATYYQRITPTLTLTSSESLLVGDAISSSMISGAQVPITPQLMQTLVFRSSSINSAFNTSLSYVTPRSWTINGQIQQMLFNSSSGSSFGQGTMLSADHPVTEEVKVGGQYNFTDFRFTSDYLPVESHWPQARLSISPSDQIEVLLRLGPIVFYSFGGSTPLVTRQSGWNINPGGLLTAQYAGENLRISLNGGQQPGLSDGLSGAALNRTTTLSLQRTLTRRLLAYLNVGFLDISSSGSDSQLLMYTIGTTYRYERNWYLTAQYQCSRNLYSGTSAATAGVPPNQQTVSNLLLVGVLWTPDPRRWRWQ